MERIFLLMLCVSLSFSSSTLRPNIVVIMADDLGWNDVSFHGSDQIPTPNIDALAYNGIILNRHYTLPTCTPSRAAFMTGKYPIRVGMQGRPTKCGEPRGLPLQETLLPQRLQDLGYITRLVGKWHLGSHRSEYTPTKRGFHSHFGYWNGYTGYYDYRIDQEEFIGYDLHRNLNTSWSENGKYATEVFTQEAVTLISTHEEDKPLFLLVSHLAVHSGRDSQLLEVPNIEEAHEKFKYIPDSQRRLYAEMTTQLDYSVGQIVTALKDKGILNNTIIIFMSDNGAQTIGMHQNWGSNWPHRGLKFTVFEGGVKGVAAIWSSSLINPQRVSMHMMHITDWYPTIYAMAGGDTNQLGGRDGVNQWPFLKDNVTSDIPRQDVLLNIGELDDIKGIIVGKWKLVQSTIKNGTYDGYFGDFEEEFSPPYNIEGILMSPAFQAIKSTQRNTAMNQNELVDKIKHLRNEATVNCPQSKLRHTEEPLCPTYCLFDITNDPCETENIILQYPEVAEILNNKLEQFKHEMVPELTTSVDPISNPLFYNNTWVSWLDDEYANKVKHCQLNSSNSHINRSEYSMVNIIFIFVLIICF